MAAWIRIRMYLDSFSKLDSDSLKVIANSKQWSSATAKTAPQHRRMPFLIVCRFFCQKCISGLADFQFISGLTVSGLKNFEN
jgi:hypothetical protein